MSGGSGGVFCFFIMFCESDRGLSIISDRFDGDGFGSWIGSGGIHALVPILCAVLDGFADVVWIALNKCEC